MTINLDLLDEESATEALRTVAAIAEANGIEWALVGGLAMAERAKMNATKKKAILIHKASSAALKRARKRPKQRLYE